MSQEITRRQALAGIASVAAAGAGTVPTSAAGKAPNGQAHGSYRFQVGAIEAFSVGDGNAAFPLFPVWGSNASEEAVRSALASHGLELAATLHFNVLLVRIGSENWLVDTGNGGQRGLLVKHLANLGLAPKDIDGIIISHLHGDHFGGLTDSAGKLVFPNAKYFVNRTEIEFWESKPSLANAVSDPAGRAGTVESAMKAAATLRASKKLELVDDGATLSTGLKVRKTGGHTVGHQIVVLENAGQRLEMVVDMFHHYLLSLRYPEWHLMFDYDAKEGAAMRRKEFDRLSTDGIRVMGYHTPFPGLGKIVKDRDSYAWAPEGWAWG